MVFLNIGVNKVYVKNQIVKTKKIRHKSFRAHFNKKKTL